MLNRFGLRVNKRGNMGKMQRQKGKAGERECAAVLALHWNATNARRSVQFCGRAGDADLIGVPGLHVECKRYSKVAALKWLRQAIADCKDGRAPVVVFREDGDTEWTFMARVADGPAIARAIADMTRSHVQGASDGA